MNAPTPKRAPLNLLQDPFDYLAPQSLESLLYLLAATL